MDYREVARTVGFPSFGFGFCPWDHGVPVMDVCWRYQIEEPTIVRQGNFTGAIPPSNAVMVHVVISDGTVQKVERLLSSSPEGRPPRHGKRSSFPYERNSIESVAFSPDGALVAAGDLWGAVHLRDVRGGGEQSVLRVSGVAKDDSRGSVRSVAFAPGGKILAAAGLYDGTVRLWDVATGRPHSVLEVIPVPKDQGRMDHVKSLAFSPDGQTLATAGYEPDVRIWDVATGRLLASLRGHASDAQVVAFSPDGKTLASGDVEGMVCLWDVATGRPRDRLPGYVAAVSGLAFSPDGRTLAVGRSDGHDASVRLRDLTTGRWRAALRVGPSLSPISLAFSPDGKTLAVADGFWRVATLWDAASGRRIGTLEGHSRGVRAVAFSPDGKLMATGGDGALKFWDTHAPAASSVITLPRSAVLVGLAAGSVALIAWAARAMSGRARKA
jgi:WD40 repeat protein